MIQINKLDHRKIQELDLHDAEISDVVCNYLNRSVSMPIVLHCPGKENVRATLDFENTSHVTITLEEPWGPGFYINEMTTSNNAKGPSDKLFSVSILLNSGDRIEIMAQTLTYSEENKCSF